MYILEYCYNSPYENDTIAKAVSLSKEPLVDFIKSQEDSYRFTQVSDDVFIRALADLDSDIEYTDSAYTVSYVIREITFLE